MDDKLIRSYDSPEQIKECLNCRRPECVNCLDPNYYEYKRMTNTKERIAELNAKGLNDAQVARYLGLSHSHVTKLRRQMDLPANMKREPYKKRGAADAGDMHL